MLNFAVPESGVEAVPARLLLPPDGQPPPPVVSRAQALPLDRLTWENFERLCLRLVELESDVEHCQLYGKKGQAQEGIDLYARLKASPPTYVVYQCKRVADFGPSRIKEAAEEFLEGRWAKSPTRLTLCTSESLSRTERADELERQNAVLKQLGCQMVAWDLEAISKRLKDHPDLVDDFFGRPWVVEFCGIEAADALGTRLDRSRINDFRDRLGQFYSRIFNIQDPGLPATVNGSDKALRLKDRYVLPDILSTESVSSLLIANPRRSDDTRSAASSDIAEEIRSTEFERPQRTREGLELWISQAKRAVVLGSAGGGKSALLKFIVLDLFSSEPTLPRLAAAWGRLLPVWLPFAFWSRLIEDRGAENAGIAETVRAWLTTWGEGHLWPLLCDALKDRRLLLLVDGLDEWSSELSGRMGLQLLQNVVEGGNIPAVVTCRPAGFRRLTLQSTSWRIGELAPLNDMQREAVSGRWFSVKRQTEGFEERADTPDPVTEFQNRRFIAELKSRPELDVLSRTPLFLLLLICLKFQQVVLPRRRFDAYDALIDQLVLIRPVENRVSAQTIPSSSDDSLTAEEVRNALAYVAFQVQMGRPTGIVDQDDLRKMVENYLEDVDVGLGLDPPQARRHAGKIAELAEGSVGILVRQGLKELSFFHRCILEHLAAVHLARLLPEKQRQLVRDRTMDVRWHEVILGLLSITRRPAEVADLMAEVQKACGNQDDVGPSCRELLAEAAFGDNQIPPALARQVAIDVLETVRDHEWLPHRERLIPHVVEGLRSTRVRSLVAGYVRPWLFSRHPYLLPDYFASVAAWPLDELTVSTLKAGIHNEDVTVQRTALACLAQLGKEDAATKSIVRSYAHQSLDEARRATALEVYVATWPNQEDAEKLIRDARRSPSFVLRYASAVARVCLGVHDSEDRDFLLFLARTRTVLPYKWSGSVADCLARGWEGDGELKRQALDAVSLSRGRDEMDRDVAYKVLLTAFAGDDDVAAHLVAQFENEKYPLLSSGHRDLWHLTARGFGGRADLAQAVDKWATRDNNARFHANDLAAVSDLGTPEVIKSALLDSMEGSFPHWAAEVLARRWWGNDPLVSEALRGIVSSDRAPLVAQVIPTVLHREEARHRLMAMLADYGGVRVDMAATALVTLASGPDDREILDCLIAAYEHLPTDHWNRSVILARLVETFAREKPVRDVVQRSLDDEDTPLSVIVRMYRDDIEIRSRCAQQVMPLHRSLRARLVEEIETRLEPSDVVKWLGRYECERDGEIKVRAARAFVRAAKALGRTAEALPSLREAICCYGPDYEQRRQAALVGLLELGRLDILEGMHERGGKGEPIRIPDANILRQNRSLYRAIAEHWPLLSAAQREDLIKRIDADGGFWSRLTTVAAEYPHLHQEVLARLREKRVAESADLQFIALVKPRSPDLKQVCMSVLDEGPPGSWPEAELQTRASLVFAEHFPSDVDEIAQALAPLSPIQRILRPAQIEALCLLEPESDIITDLFQLANAERRPSMSFSAYYPVMLARVADESVMSFVIAHALRARTEPVRLKMLARHLARRVRSDEALRNHLAERVGDAHGGEQLCILQVLTSVPNPNVDLASVARKRLQQEVKAPFSSFAIDLGVGEVRAAVVSLLSLLESLIP